MLEGEVLMASIEAAVRTGRSYIGMEMDETYFNIVKGRVENEL